MFDWVYFTQSIGKFKDVKTDTKTIYKKEALSERQQRQGETNLTVAEQCNALLLTDDITYSIGDYVFVPDINRFAQIESLLVIQSVKWADLTIFPMFTKSMFENIKLGIKSSRSMSTSI